MQFPTATGSLQSPSFKDKMRFEELAILIRCSYSYSCSFIPCPLFFSPFFLAEPHLSFLGLFTPHPLPPPPSIYFTALFKVGPFSLPTFLPFFLSPNSNGIFHNSLHGLS